MDDAKKVFAVFLLVLFVLIVIGVTLSKIASQKGKTAISGGGNALERALFPNRPVKEPTLAGQGQAQAQKQTKDTSNTVVIRKTAEGQAGNVQTNPVPTGKIAQKTTTKGGSQTVPTIVKQNQNQASSEQVSGATSDNQIGSPQAESIPSTGAPTLSLLFSLGGLGSGIFLKRKIG
ncbi:hypothetical protein A3D06_00020 [Candidatus Roizmanbacteria bacterium RIFCSPHIGHO2_02_FULL_40_9]|uniref:Uncharacterized protein n=1 Tax=Candidatus Roizmanbacteria bacterium RIFCSPHIGHO2_02_FULL_40_9 TaxID=1802042 RepID=A0A1F7HE35_9BACT|nr:MAG: hypothetical protein A3D06_00020 [Candidatus Roizmanbacteria bacterium RIFCSPHIGHO2_02_FULL_40_9]